MDSMTDTPTFKQARAAFEQHLDDQQTPTGKLKQADNLLIGVQDSVALTPAQETLLRDARRSLTALIRSLS